MPSKISDDRLRASFRRAALDLARVDTRVAKAQAVLDTLEATRAQAQATIDTADADRAEAASQLEHLRTIARNRGIDLDAELAQAAQQAQADEQAEQAGQQQAQPEQPASATVTTGVQQGRGFAVAAPNAAPNVTAAPPYTLETV